MIINTGAVGLKLYEVAPFVTLIDTGPYTFGACGMNLDVYNSLPQDVQKVLSELGRGYSQQNADIISKRQGGAIEVYKKNGCTIAEMPQAQRQPTVHRSTVQLEPVGCTLLRLTLQAHIQVPFLVHTTGPRSPFRLPRSAFVARSRSSRERDLLVLDRRRTSRLAAGADASATDNNGQTAADLAKQFGHSALASYIVGAQSWTALHFAADARDADALRECLSSGARPDAAVESPHADMRTALSIAASNSYPCAAPVDERCVALLRSGAVWSIEHHALVPAHERLAASARALLMGVKRRDACRGSPPRR